MGTGADGRRLQVVQSGEGRSRFQHARQYCPWDVRALIRRVSPQPSQGWRSVRSRQVLHCGPSTVRPATRRTCPQSRHASLRPLTRAQQEPQSRSVREVRCRIRPQPEHCSSGWRCLQHRSQTGPASVIFRERLTSLQSMQLRRRLSRQHGSHLGRPALRDTICFCCPQEAHVVVSADTDQLSASKKSGDSIGVSGRTGLSRVTGPGSGAAGSSGVIGATSSSNVHSRI